MSFARYWRRICDEYVKGGRFDEVYDRIRNQIDELVETDPNALYNYEEYTVAAELLYETINLRAESINGQLNGTIPSTDAGQRQDSSHLIDASHIDVTLMGQFNMGGFADNRKGKRDEADDSSSEGFSFPGSEVSSPAICPVSIRKTCRKDQDSPSAAETCLIWAVSVQQHYPVLQS